MWLNLTLDQDMLVHAADVIIGGFFDSENQFHYLNMYEIDSMYTIITLTEYKAFGTIE